jgi:D-tagatose-1,6-bisphosphate aldolase subunit GatZ/KbaZ
MQPSEFLRNVVRRNRQSGVAATFAVCSAHPIVLRAAILQSRADGTLLHVESTSNQVNQFGGYTGTTPYQYANQIRRAAERAGLPPNQVLLGADHLGPYNWRSAPASEAMAHACQLAAQSVLAGYLKIHLDASMPCGDDPRSLLPQVVAERTAILCHAAETGYRSLPAGSPRPLYVIGTEVPPPGGEVTGGEAPTPTTLEDMQSSLETFRTAFMAHDLASAWENVIGMVVQPGVEFGDSSVFDYDREKARHLVLALPSSPEMVYEAHSTDYQKPSSLARMVEDHFAILKVGPWLTFAFREAIFALAGVEGEMPEHRSSPSGVRQALEVVMLQSPEYWKPYYTGSEAQNEFSRGFSLSDRCRYYWPLKQVAQAVDRLMYNLKDHIPLALVSQYFPVEFELIRSGELENSAPAIVIYHIQRVLKTYAAACGHTALSEGGPDGWESEVWPFQNDRRSTGSSQIGFKESK